jgi:hypothetical protein
MKKVALNVDPRHVEFLYEQDGEIERELKRRLVPLLEAAGGVRAAYLAVADYHDGSRPSVVLCVRADRGRRGGYVSAVLRALRVRADNGVDHAFIRKVGKVFAEIFNSTEHLDVFFVDARQESEVRAVCAPFFGG